MCKTAIYGILPYMWILSMTLNTDKETAQDGILSHINTYSQFKISRGIVIYIHLDITMTL